MGKGVFLHRSDSIYDDQIAEQYQFPKQYLGRARQFVGDWVIYYEPKRGGARGYFAMAKVETIVPDPQEPAMFLALIRAGSLLQFEHPVPFRDPTGLIERGLLNEFNIVSGRAQAAVRPLSEEDFSRIVDRAFDDDDPAALPRHGAYEPAPAMQEERMAFAHAIARDRISYLGDLCAGGCGRRSFHVIQWRL